MTTRTRARPQESPAFIPSVNLAADLNRLDAVPRFRFSAKSLALLRQFVAACRTGSVERAWSIVGPYGAGKSTFALMLSALLRKDESPWIDAVLSDIAKLDSTLHDAIQSIRAEDPFEVVSVAAGEPLSSSLIQALKPLAMRRRKSKSDVHPRLIRHIARMENRASTTPQDLGVLLALAARLVRRSRRAGLLLVFDEFGRTIERAVARGDLTDLHAIQEVAEAANRSGTTPAHVVVLLHQNFDHYAAGAGRRHRAEWAKVQGRFRQVSFVEDPDAVLNSVADALTEARSSAPIGWSDREWSLVRELHPFSDDTRHWKELSPALYPLGLIAAYALPRISAIAGQNDRSVYAFLHSDDPAAMPAAVGRLATLADAIRIDTVVDYFLLRARSAYMEPRVQARLAELLVALERTSHEVEAALVKAIAAITMIGGPLWPTEGCLAASLGMDKESKEWKPFRAALDDLLRSRVVVHRRYSDEFHLWRGTDVDVGQAVEEIRADVSMEFDLASFLNARLPLQPFVARRHSFDKGTVRVFARLFVNPRNTTDRDYIEQQLDSLLPKPDGLILYVASTTQEEVTAADGAKIQDCSRPVIIVTPEAPLNVDDLALDLRALAIVAQDDQVSGDPVAKVELQMRERAMGALLEHRVASFVGPNARCTWRSGRKRLRPTHQRAIQQLLSDLSDKTYPRTPEIRNELINRHRLSTSVVVGVKKIVAALLDGRRAKGLGFSGNGPEVSIFHAVFEKTGWYSKEGENSYVLAPPRRPGWARDLWHDIEVLLAPAHGRVAIADVWARLREAPFGIHDGLAPILIWGVLLGNRDQMCLYEKGTYIPEWSAELYDRMVRWPELFEVATLATADARRIFKELSAQIPPAHNEATELNQLLRKLYGWYRSLPETTKRTRLLSPPAQEFRRVVSSSTDPAAMLLDELPAAIGCSSPRTARGRKEFVQQFGECVAELDGVYRARLADIVDVFCRALGERTSVSALRELFGGLGDELVETAISSEARTLLIRARDQQPDAAWVESLAAAVVGQSPRFWIDEHAEEFGHKAARLAREFELARSTVALVRQTPNQRRLALMSPAGVLVDDVFEVSSTTQSRRATRAIIKQIRSLPMDQRKTVVTELLEEVLGRKDRPNDE